MSVTNKSRLSATTTKYQLKPVSIEKYRSVKEQEWLATIRSKKICSKNNLCWVTRKSCLHLTLVNFCCNCFPVFDMIANFLSII